MRHIHSSRQLRVIANLIRQDIIKMTAAAGSGHPAGALGMADVFTALYFHIMHHNPKKPNWEDRDRLILSNGHICAVQYAAMARCGYFPVKELLTFRKLGSRLQGHPHNLSLLGIENTGGPLGQGVSIAAGVALGAKMDKKKFYIFLSMSDGELEEGQSWEAIMFAAKYKLDNLIGFVDRNYIQIDGYTEDVMPLDPLNKKFKAFNWHVIEIDGNGMKQILSAFTKAKRLKGKPKVIICNTTPGKGVSFMENNYKWHGKAPSHIEAVTALRELRGFK